MKHETVSVKSPCDGLALSALAVIPDAEKEMRGIVQLVHGMSEHKTRYINFMEFLADHGFLCIIHDHRGHGKSVKSTADLGYFYGAGGSGLVEDTLAVNQYARSRWPGLPVCLLGHSMGSLVARAFTKQHDDLIDGLILIGCPSKNPGVKAGLLLVRIIKLLCGGRHKSLLLDKLAIPRSKNRNAVSAAEWISSMESVIKSYEMDALCGFTFTVDGYEGLFSLMIDGYSKNGWNVKNPSLPVHFASGAEDVCLLTPQRFDASLEHIKQTGHPNVTFRLYDGMRHEILNEKDRQTVYRDLLAVIEKDLT